jgi:hypothetical protein
LKTPKKEAVGRTRRGWKDTIKMGLEEIEWGH